MNHKLHTGSEKKQKQYHDIHKLTGRFQPARLGFTHLKHMEVLGETCLFCHTFRHVKPCGWQSCLDNAHAEMLMMGKSIPDKWTSFVIESPKAE